MRFLLVLLCLTALALGETAEDLKKLEAQVKALGGKVAPAVALDARLRKAQDWRKGVLAVKSEARNLSPMVTDAVKIASFGFGELRATRGVGNRSCALRVLIGANERQEILQGRFPYLSPRQTEDGLWLAGVAPPAPGATLEPYQKPADDLKQKCEKARAQIEAVKNEAANKVALAKLQKDNPVLAKQVGWKTLGPEKPEQIAPSVLKALPKSLTPGLELKSLKAGSTEKLCLARDVYWTGTHFDLELSGTPPEIARQLASWEKFGLDRPLLLETVQMDLEGAKVRLIAFVRQSF